MMMLKAGAMVAWWSSSCALPKPWHQCRPGSSREGWLLTCSWAPHSSADRTFCATCIVAVCVIPSPKMASNPSLSA